MREPSRGSGWKEGRKGRAEERKETVGSWVKPGPGGTLPASAAYTSFPAPAAQRAGRLQPGPRERGQGPGPAPPRSLGCLPRSPGCLPGSPPCVCPAVPGVCPAAPGLQPEGRGKVSSAGGAHSEGEGLPSQAEEDASPPETKGELRGGNPRAQAGAAHALLPPPPHPSAGRRPWAPRSGMRTDCTWDHPAKGGRGFCETKSFQLCVESFRLSRALAQHLFPAMQHIPCHLDRTDSLVTLQGKTPHINENTEM